MKTTQSTPGTGINQPAANNTPAQSTAQAPAAHSGSMVPPCADPGPLGLAAFALTTFVLSLFNAAILPGELEPMVLPLALFYGGVAQVLAGMWEFRRQNTFGALAFTSYGAFWLAFAGYVRVIAPELPVQSAHLATGVFLLAWFIFTLYMTVVSWRTSIGLILVFAPLTLTFALLTIGALAQMPTLTHIGGYAGLVTAATAWYNSFAGALNTTWKRGRLPLGQRQ